LTEFGRRTLYDVLTAGIEVLRTQDDVPRSPNFAPGVETSAPN